MVMWPGTLSVWPLGGAKVFFQTRFSRQPLELSPKFSRSCAPPPEGLYLSSGGRGVGGQIWGPGPPKWFFFVFFTATVTGLRGEICNAEVIGTGPPFDPWNLKKNIVNKYFEKMEFKIFGGVALFRVCPLRGLPSPIWPLLILVIGTLTKIVFVRGWLPPIWGRYGVWPVCSLVHFFSKFLPEILEILSWSIVPTAYYRFWDFKENLIRVTQINFVQISEKSLFGVRKAKIFSPEAVTMG